MNHSNGTLMFARRCFLGLACGWLLAGSALAAQTRHPYVNATAGGPLRPGVYGRIEIGNAPPPPLLYAQPVRVAEQLGAASAKPVYLYVPTGHARKWSRHCHKYQACARPVYFVRMDDSPGKLGKWKTREPNSAGSLRPVRGIDKRD